MKLCIPGGVMGWGDNNGQATHGARKQAWRTQAAWANNSPIFLPPGLHPPTACTDMSCTTNTRQQSGSDHARVRSDIARLRQCAIGRGITFVRVSVQSFTKTQTTDKQATL